MPKVRLDPKFTYSNSTFEMNFRTHTTPPYNYQLFSPSDIESEVYCPIYIPRFTLPAVGNSHSQRHGNRITVTSLRLKSIFTLDKYLCVPNIIPWATGGTSDPAISTLNAQYVNKFLKFRYFVVEFDEDLEITAMKLYQWFKRTYCWCRPNSDSTGSVYNNPVSVHSNILHETTEFTGKFNILCDKCFTLSSRKPQLSMDITIPLNRQFVFDEDDTTGEGLLFPNLWVFVLPPLQFCDIDPTTQTQMLSFQRQSDYSTWKFCDVETFTKLSFVDL